jgi:hypothetical protein
MRRQKIGAARVTNLTSARVSRTDAIRFRMDHYLDGEKGHSGSAHWLIGYNPRSEHMNPDAEILARETELQRAQLASDIEALDRLLDDCLCSPALPERLSRKTTISPCTVQGDCESRAWSRSNAACYTLVKPLSLAQKWTRQPFWMDLP